MYYRYCTYYPSIPGHIGCLDIFLQVFHKLFRYDSGIQKYSCHNTRHHILNKKNVRLYSMYRFLFSLQEDKSGIHRQQIHYVQLIKELKQTPQIQWTNNLNKSQSDLSQMQLHRQESVMLRPRWYKESLLFCFIHSLHRDRQPKHFGWSDLNRSIGSCFFNFHKLSQNSIYI